MFLAKMFRLWCAPPSHERQSFPCGSCNFSKAGPAETHSIHSARAVTAHDRRLLSHPTSPWLSPHDRTENLDQRDFAQECYTSCVMCILQSRACASGWYILNVCDDRHGCWAPQNRRSDRAYRHGKFRWELGPRPALVMCPGVWVVSEARPPRYP